MLFHHSLIKYQYFEFNINFSYLPDNPRDSLKDIIQKVLLDLGCKQNTDLISSKPNIATSTGSNSLAKQIVPIDKPTSNFHHSTRILYYNQCKLPKMCIIGSSRCRFDPAKTLIDQNFPDCIYLDCQRLVF